MTVCQSNDPLWRAPRFRRASAQRLQGAALPIVLLISSMMLVTSAAWFEASLAASRAAANLRETLQAFHAADSALTLCAFSAGAFTPIAQWPGSVAPPQCLLEAWRLTARPEAKAYLLTARGFGRTMESQVWLQLELVVDGEKIERHWRRVAARPF
jgi:Tfp pilus assembly protein PilX